MSIKKIMILGAALPFLGATAHADEALLELMYKSYEQAIPTANIADIPEILSGERQALIKSVEDCTSQLDGFGGLEIRHEPKYLVAVKFQKEARRKLKPCTNDSIFLGVLAPQKKVDLETAQSRLIEQLNLAFMDSESSISFCLTSAPMSQILY